MADEKELKDQRVPIMMTPSELEAIDDWMFANRIRSRGEAIRRLTAGGLTLDKGAVDLLNKVVADMNKVTDLVSGQAGILAPLPEGEEISRTHALELASISLEVAGKYEEIVWSTLERTADLLSESVERSRGPLPRITPIRDRFANLLKALRKAIDHRSDE